MTGANEQMNWATSETPVSVTVPTRSALMQDLETRLARGVGFSIATLNLDHAVKLARDTTFAAAYAAQTHVTADGNPIVWLCRLAGQKDVKLIPGSELIDPICALAAKTETSVGLYGATDRSLAAARDALIQRYPGLKVSFLQAPAMGFDPEGVEADAAIDGIRQSGAKIIFLALGAPRQERFAARAQGALENVGFLSIGAGLDFISGAQTRAPVWVRRFAAEWLWRMAHNPGRLFRRYMLCIAILPKLTFKSLKARAS